MWPGEEKDFRLVTVDGDTTVRSANQDKCVVFILRDKKRERERMGKGKYYHNLLTETKEREQPAQGLRHELLVL